MLDELLLIGSIIGVKDSEKKLMKFQKMNKKG